MSSVSVVEKELNERQNFVSPWKLFKICPLSKESLSHG